MPRDMFAYARSLAAHKRTHPADDVMTVLATDADLTAAELEMFFFLLTVAGNDTVRSAAPAACWSWPGRHGPRLTSPRSLVARCTRRARYRGGGTISWASWRAA